ncbi:hypothetical protein GBA52_025338 [Prunus armeniaca]|nr:hypothetical protein GBA52_025338 [Prunus armeniaca]
MGKIPSSLRSSVSTSLITKPSSLVPNESPSHRPHHFPKKTTKKILPQLSEKTREPTFRNPFTSANLSDAKKFFNSIVTTTKVPLDLRVHNALLQSYASISTLNDSISLFNHMIKTHPPFSPDQSTYHIIKTTHLEHLRLGKPTRKRCQREPEARSLQGLLAWCDNCWPKSLCHAISMAHIESQLCNLGQNLRCWQCTSNNNLHP